MRRQAVETRGLTGACQLGTPQQSRSVAEAGAQARGPGHRSTVKPPDRAGSGHGAGAERSRPGWEDTGTREPGGRPEPQDQTKHFAPIKTLHRAVEHCRFLTPASEIGWHRESLCPSSRPGVPPHFLMTSSSPKHSALRHSPLSCRISHRCVVNTDTQYFNH